jgi:hypothetical protein
MVLEALAASLLEWAKMGLEAVMRRQVDACVIMVSIAFNLVVT